MNSYLGEQRTQARVFHWREDGSIGPDPNAARYRGHDAKEQIMDRLTG